MLFLASTNYSPSHLFPDFVCNQAQKHIPKIDPIVKIALNISILKTTSNTVIFPPSFILKYDFRPQQKQRSLMHQLLLNTNYIHVPHRHI